MKPVLFDLDGTLADSRAIVTDIFATVQMDHCGVVADPRDYLWCCGPPLEESFRILGWEYPEEGVKAYRDIYKERFFDTPMYEGVMELLEDMYRYGVPMVIATSKLQSMASMLLRHYGVDEYFLDICGADPQGKYSHKSVIIARALDVLKNHGIDELPFMVGDRMYDIEGAHEHGLHAIAVTWGAGTSDEWEKADYCVSSVEELRTLICAI
ncbi:MAG: HAD hydrolase-like protein [Actinomycetaceae bacterium]|nr:HAD hydrolase-like protein [Actinomycetaceae bacterium]